MTVQYFSNILFQLISILAIVAIMSSVTYCKRILASVIMANVFIVKVLWQMYLL